MPPSIRMKRHIGPTLVFIFPFLYYFRFIYPNTSLLVVGNDFYYLYYSYKTYLADLVAHGHFPTWSPAEACGYSFFGNPFAAPLYPLNVLPIAARLVFGNYNIWFHQIFTVFGVSLFSLGTYRWLHQVYGKSAPALFTSVILSACWSIGEFMRFPNAIHAIAWVPWVLGAIHSAHVESRLRPVYFGMFALCCEITAGYPYFVVYSFFLYAAYGVYLHWASPGPNWSERLILQISLIATPVLLTAPYVSAVSFVSRLTRDRAGGEFAYATAFPFSMVDLVGGLVFPPICTVEGCFYPGIFTVFLIALFFWRHPNNQEKIGVLVAFIGLLTLILGYRSYWFAPLWSFLPIVNQMRVFSRMTIIALPVLAIAIHQGYGFFAEQLGRATEDRRLMARSAWIAFGSIFVIQVLAYFVKDQFHHEYALYDMQNFPDGSTELDFLMSTLFTFVVVLSVIAVNWAEVRHGSTIALGIVLAIVTQDTGIQGRFLWARPVATLVAQAGIAEGASSDRMGPAWDYAKRKADFFHLVRDYFALDRLDEHPDPWGSLGLTNNLTAVPTAAFDYESYWKFHENTRPADWHRLMGQQKVFFHSALHPDAASFLDDSAAHSAKLEGPTIEYFDGSELRMKIANAEPGYLTWVDNFDPGWSATVDGRAVAIERSMQTFKAIRIASTGRHRVRFVYRPVISIFAYAAMGAGLLGPALLALWDRRRRRSLSARERPGAKFPVRPIRA
jgi:hypothetical protein